MAQGAEAGLSVLEGVAGAPSLQGYHLLPSVRGDLLARLGRAEEAREEFERAAAMTHNAREREVLLGRAKAAETSTGG
jgi:predicted RNA polymerase sigma factor